MRRALSRSIVRDTALAAFASLLLTACGPSVESAFSNCAETAYRQAIAGTKAQLPKELTAMFEKAARVQAEQKCDIIRDECRKDPQAEECRRLIRQYGKK